MKAILKKECLEIIRTKKLLILAVIFLFVAISSPILAKLIPTLFKNIDLQGVKLEIPEATWRDSIDQFVKNISQLAMIVLVFVFAGSIAEEKNKKTLEILLTKPISRPSLIIAKYLAALATITVVFSLSAIIFYYYTSTIFGQFSAGNFGTMGLALLIYLWQVVSLTVFCSTFTNNQIVSAGAAFFLEIVLVSIIGNIDKIAKYVPGYILGQYRGVMDGSLINLMSSNIVSILLILVLIIFSVLIFRKQEIER